MVIRRLFIGTVAAAGLVTAVATATPSDAQPNYPPGAPSVTLSASTVVVGGAVTLTGSGFLPNSIVTITSFVSGPVAIAPLGSRQAPDGGVLRARVVPAALAGGAYQRPGRHRCSTGRTCQVRVDAEGDLATPFFLTRPGVTTIRISGRDTEGDPTTVTVTVQVTGPAGQGVGRPGKGGLAFTGRPVLGGLTIGLIMVVVGTGLALGFRRRRPRTPIG